MSKFKRGFSKGIIFTIKKLEEIGRKIFLPFKRKGFKMTIPIRGNVLFHFSEDIPIKGKPLYAKILALLLETEEHDFTEWYEALTTLDKKKLKKLIEDI
jgi:hypothetical protein